MAFAEIPISVPNNFPDLLVSSYYRKDGSSHESYSAVDMVLKDLPYGREKGSLYWYWYIGVVDLLWRSQRRGLCRMAMPPVCPHYHFNFSGEKNLAGVELIKQVKLRNGKTECQYVSHTNFDNKAVVRNQWVADLREETKEWNPVWSWERAKAEWGYLTTKNSKRIRVYTNNYIGLEDLQAKLSWMYGSGSMLQQTGDTLAQVIGYENTIDATEKLVTQNPYVLVPLAASVLFGAYLLSSRINAPQEYHRSVKT